jgi:hypothetical protein
MMLIITYTGQDDEEHEEVSIPQVWQGPPSDIGKILACHLEVALCEGSVSHGGNRNFS